MSSLTREQLTILLNDPSELGNKALGFGDYKEVIAELVRDALALRALPAGEVAATPCGLCGAYLAAHAALTAASPAPVAAEVVALAEEIDLTLGGHPAYKLSITTNRTHTLAREILRLAGKRTYESNVDKGTA